MPVTRSLSWRSKALLVCAMAFGVAPAVEIDLQQAPEVRDLCNRDDPAFTHIDDPFADAMMRVALERLPQRLADPAWAEHCALPSFKPQRVRGRGVRHFDKYDQVFIAAAWFWVATLDDGGNPENVGDLAHLMKVMSWYESQVGYRSGFSNRRSDGSLRYPQQHPGFIDTEDVLQVGNPADLPIHEKVRELVTLHFTHARDQIAMVPTGYTHRNISGTQSIFYGTAWWGYKYLTCGRRPLEAVRRYNGNKRVDPWNGREHRDNYADSVHVLFTTGVARSPGDGQQWPLVLP